MRRPVSVIVLMLLGLSMFLAACGSGAATSSGPVQLVYWNFSPELQANADLFNKTHTNIKVTSLRQASNAPYYAKLDAAIKAGNAPDIALLEYQYVPQFIAAKGLVDLTPYGANSVKDQFVDWTWAQVSYNGKAYGIPQDTGPTALYYRKDLFTAAGYPNGPATWDEYADAAAKIHAADPTHYIATFGPKTSGLYVSYMWQRGAHLFKANADGSWTVSVNSSEAKQVAQFWNTLVNKGLVLTIGDFDGAWNKGLNDGTIASWASAVWGQNVISGNAKDTTGKWAVAQLPQWTKGEQAAGNWGGSATVVTKSSKHPKEAAEFAMWLNTNAESIKTEVNGVGLYPAAKAGAQIPEVLKANDFYGGQVVNNVFADAATHVDVNFQWAPNMLFFYTTQEDLMSNAVANKTSFTAVLDDLQQKEVADLQSKGFKVNP